MASTPAVKSDLPPATDTGDDSQRLAPGTLSTYSKDVSWYTPGPPRLPDDMKALLRSWSGLGSEDGVVERHVESVRDKAWSIHPYPCIGGYRFVGLGLAAHPSFNTVVSSLKSPSTASNSPITNDDLSYPIFLDLGCGLGQDIRSLVFAGVPSSHIVGVELDPAFIEIGYDLFRDRSKLGTKFLLGDILTLEPASAKLSDSANVDGNVSSTPNSNPLSSLIGRVSFIWISAFLHLWDLPGQIAVCHKLILLLGNQKGVRILGRHAGSKTPGEIVHVTNKGGKMYRHNPDSFRQMWEDVLAETKTDGKWVTRAWFEEDEESPAKDVLQNKDSDWLTKVVVESEGKEKGSNADADDRTYFMVWEVERIA